MENRNGIGSILYGKRNMDPKDGSYQAVGWVIFLFLPIFPLGTYRVKKAGSTETSITNGVFVGTSTPYQITKIKMDWVQVITTFFPAYIIVFLMYLLFIK